MKNLSEVPENRMKFNLCETKREFRGTTEGSIQISVKSHKTKDDNRTKVWVEGVF